MRVFRYLMLFTGALALAACSDDEDGASITNIPDLAYTRFVNVVPDTGLTNWRFVDILEFSPAAFELEYRSFTPYQGTQVGSHNLRIFPTSSDIDVVSQRIIDTTLTFQAGRYYTIVHAGNARSADGAADADRIIVIEDPIPAPAAGRYAIRAMNLSATTVDVYATAATGDPLPATPIFDAVPFGTATAYVERDTGAVALRATADGSVAPVLASAVAPAGAAGDPVDNLTTIGGSRQSGSAILGIFSPRTVAGSDAPQETRFQSPAWVYIIDKHPR